MFLIGKIMKFNVLEHFGSDELEVYHFDKHVKDGDRREFPSKLYPNKKSYTKGADKLAKKPCAGSDLSDGDIVGFKSKRHGGCYVKYDQVHQTLVAYRPDLSQPCGILVFTYHKYRNANDRYNEEKDKYMIGEIDEN